MLFAGAAFHLALASLVSCRDTLSAVSLGGTIFPKSAALFAEKSERHLGTALDGRHGTPGAWNHLVITYLDLAGIEVGYGFFAPHVPDGYKMVFVLHYADGRIEYDEPHGASPGTRLRMTSLLDVIGRTENDAVRAGIIKLLAQSLWRTHSGLSRIRILFGTVTFPPLNEYANGDAPSFHLEHVYDLAPEGLPQEISSD